MKESVYYGQWLTEKVPYGNVSTIESNYYDRWTGNPKKLGMPFNSIRKYSDSNLYYKESRYQYPDVIKSTVYFLEWNAGRIQEIRQIIFSKEAFIKFEFNGSGLLEREFMYRIRDGREIISEGFRHEYMNGNGKYLPDKVFYFFRLPQGEYEEYIEREYKYDKRSRVAQIYQKGKHDDAGRTIRKTYNYLSNQDIIEVSIGYLDKNEDHSKRYIRIINGVEFIVPTFEIALQIELNDHGDIVRMGSDIFSYDFDVHNNWIRKYDSKVLVEERKVLYR